LKTRTLLIIKNMIGYYYWTSKVKSFRENRTPSWFMCQRTAHFQK